MRYLVIIPVLVIGLVLSTAISNAPLKEESSQPMTKFNVAHSIIKNVEETLITKYQFHSIGVSEATHKDDELYKEIGIWFEARGPLSKEKGRRIIVDCVNELLKQINTNSDFKQYMHEYPFTVENVNICLFVKDQDRRSLYYPNISVFAVHRGKVEYKTNSPEKKYEYYSCESETWEEALQKVTETDAKGSASSE